MNREFKLEDKFCPSPPCNCEICRKFCLRPGWWTVYQASKALAMSLSNRMMLEIAPDFSFAVLSPAFKGCEGSVAVNEFSNAGCNFLISDLCQLHGTELQPLECSVCHHESPGIGSICHLEIEKQWNGSEGQELVMKWMQLTRFWERLTPDPDEIDNNNSASKKRN